MSKKVCKCTGGQDFMAEEVELLFETSWEVCNKVGGIYTVLSTKAKELESRFGQRLVFIGPDVWDAENPSPYFKENKTLLKSASRWLSLPYGIKIRTGKWMIPGEPIAVLVDFKGVYPHLNEIYGQMWADFKVDSLQAYGDYDEGCAFAVASAIVMEAIARRLDVASDKVMAHFNEWTTGMGLLYLRAIMPQAASLFTTHATSIGRSICGNGKNLYEYFFGYQGDQMAAELNMESKHSVEKTAAHQADCFTTVSDVTASECRQLLELAPQVVTPNGFEPAIVPDEAKRKLLREGGRQRLLKVVEALTGHKLPEDTLLVATSGRNEYRNKGLDMFIDSINSLRSQSAALNRPVVAFVLTPAWVKEPSAKLTENIKNGHTGDVTPDYLTHRLNNEESDSVTRRITESGGNGNSVSGDGKVDIIFVPCYLDGKDGVIDIEYYDLLPALDLTVFPSYYEPWGYTPLESVAFGVPTITTDKAGFGQWTLSAFGTGFNKCGVEVLTRTDGNYWECVEDIAHLIADFANAGDSAVAKINNYAISIAKKAEWKDFIAYYEEAFEVALKRRNQRIGDNK